MDLRERVVAAVDAGMTQLQAAARFGVSLRTVESMSRAIAGLPPDPGQARTPSGRRRRAGRPLKQKA